MNSVKDFFKKVKNHFVPSPDNVYRPHILRRSWLVFFLAVILTAEGVFLVDLLARQSAMDFLAAVLPGEVIALTNTERSAYSLNSVSENALLNAAAKAKAEDMAAKGYFSHQGPDGKEPWAWMREAGYSYAYAGENLAVRFTGSSEVVNAWMASPSHKANIVKPAYTEIGVGVAEGTFQGQPATFVVQYFGTPKSNVATAALAAPATPAATTTQPSAQAQVEGAATIAPASDSDTDMPTPIQTTEPGTTITTEPVPSPWSTFAQQILKSDAQPSAPVLWVLGGVAALLVIGLALAFFIHIQVQSTEMLAGGAVVAVIAIGLLTLNFYTPYVSNNEQSAAVFGAMPSQGGFISSSAASISSPQQ